MNNPPIVGQLVGHRAERDAIHVAIAPVIAEEILYPGQPIGFSSVEENIVSNSAPAIGIVDPYLKVYVYPGQRFWMFMYPQTITSLRHDWTHPAFTKAKSPDEVWLTSFAESVGLGYEELIQGTRDFLSHGEYLNRGPLLDGVDLPTDFWAHYQCATGEIVPEKSQRSFFTCSC